MVYNNIETLRDDSFDYFPHQHSHLSSVLSSVKHNGERRIHTFRKSRQNSEDLTLSQRDIKVLEEMEKRRKLKNRRNTGNVII